MYTPNNVLNSKDSLYIAVSLSITRIIDSSPDNKSAAKMISCASALEILCCRINLANESSIFISKLISSLNKSKVCPVDAQACKAINCSNKTRNTLFFLIFSSFSCGTMHVLIIIWQLESYWYCVPHIHRFAHIVASWRKIGQHFN